MPSKMLGAKSSFRSHFQFLKHTRGQKKGQALVEYVILLSIAATISLTFFATFNRLIQEGIQRFNAVFESELRTGELNGTEHLDIWKN